MRKEFARRSLGAVFLTLAITQSWGARGSDFSFFDAVKSGNIDAVRDDLKAGQNVMARNELRDTALHVAVAGGNMPLVRLLLDSGSRVDEPGHDGLTPLMIAVSAGSVEAVRLLLLRGADTKLRDLKGESAALFAARLGSLPELQLLAEKGADFNVKDRDGDFPLLAAATLGHEDAVTFLLLQKAQPNESDAHGNTALIRAAGAAGTTSHLRHGSLRIVRELVDAQASVNAVSRDSGGLTPLYAALWAGNRVIATFLLDHGADSSLRRRDGGTDFSVLRTACDLRRLPAYQDKLRDLRCDRLVKPGSYALCGTGGATGAALAATEISEANANLIKMPALRYSCPESGGRSCVIESHDAASIGEGGEEGEEGHQDWRRTIRFPSQSGGGPNESFVWTPEACGAGCGQPEITLKRMLPAHLKLGKKEHSVALLLRPQACPRKGKCKWVDTQPVRANQKIQALAAGHGFFCVKVNDAEDSARFGWLPAGKVTLAK